MLTTGELHNDLGGDYYQHRDPERITKRLFAWLEALDHHVTLEALAARRWISCQIFDLGLLRSLFHAGCPTLSRIQAKVNLSAPSSGDRVRLGNVLRNR